MKLFAYLTLGMSLFSNLYAQDVSRSVINDGKRKIVSIAISDVNKRTYLRFSDYDHDGKIDEYFKEERYKNSTNMLTVSDDKISTEEWDFSDRDDSNDVKDFLSVDNRDFYFYTPVTYQLRKEFFLSNGKLTSVMIRKEMNGIVREQGYIDDNCDSVLDSVREYSGNSVESHTPTEEDKEKFAEYAQEIENIKTKAEELEKIGQGIVK